MCTVTTNDLLESLNTQLTAVNTTLVQSTSDLQNEQEMLKTQNTALTQITDTMTATNAQLQKIEDAVSDRMKILSQLSSIPTESQIRDSVEQQIQQVSSDADNVIKQTKQEAEDVIKTTTQKCLNDPVWKAKQIELNQQLASIRQEIKDIQAKSDTDIQQVTTGAQSLLQPKQDSISQQSKLLSDRQANIQQLQQQINSERITLRTLVQPELTTIAPMDQIASTVVTNVTQLGQMDAVSVILPVGSVYYVGGYFSKIGGISANNIAMYNPQTNIWSPLGSGTNNSVSNMVMDTNNRLYIVGNFTEAGNVPCNRIAIWDGNRWSPLGSGIQTQYGGPSQIGFYDGMLYVSGGFSSAGDVPGTARIAMWDGNKWYSVGGGLQNNNIWVMKAGWDGIYIGGQFYNQPTIDGRSSNGFIRWDGKAWRWVGDFDLGVTSVWIRSPTEMYIGGRFTKINGQTINRIARWDGNKWNSLGNGLSDVVNVLYMDQTYLYAAGQFTDRLTRWDGQTWSPMGVTFSGKWDSIYTMVVLKNKIYIGGYFSSVNNVPSQKMAVISYITKSAVEIQAQIQQYTVSLNSLQKQLDDLVINNQKTQEAIQTLTTDINSITQRRDQQIQTIRTNAQSQTQKLQDQLSVLQTQASQPYTAECKATIDSVTAQQNAQVLQTTTLTNQALSEKINELRKNINIQLQNATDQKTRLEQMLSSQERDLIVQGIDPKNLQDKIQSLKNTEATLQQQLTATQTQRDTTQSKIQTIETRISDLQEQLTTLHSRMNEAKNSPIKTIEPTYVSPIRQ
jgi:hypothetical protein